MQDKTVVEERMIEDLPDYDGLFEKNRQKKNVSARILFSFFSEHKKHFLLAQFFYLLKNAPVWILPLITSSVINLATKPETATVWDFVSLGLLAFALIFQNVWTHVWYAMQNNRALRHISAGIRNSLIRKLQQLSITYHKDIETGRLQSKFLRDVESVEGLNRQIFEVVVPTIISLIVTIAITLSKSRIIMLFYVVVIPVSLLLISAFREKMRSENRQYRSVNEQLSARITDMLTMIPVTKAHGLENTEIHRLGSNILHVEASGLELDKTVAKFGSLHWVVSTMLSTLCLIFTGVLAYFGKIEVGDIVLYQSYFSSISSQALMLVNIFPQLNTGLEALRSLSEIMLSDEIEDNRDKIRLRYVHGSVQFEDVSYHYPNTRQDVVSHLNLDVSPGQCVAFVGASGSGKTTVMNMIIGFLQATDGVVKIDGKPIGALHLQDYRHFLSVVPQNSILFTGTIRENILYGLEGISEEKLWEIVDRANIREFIEKMPQGLDTVVGEHGDKLSGGQKQRISIARALIRDPRIIILDEATSALDNISEFEVQKAMNELMKGRTTFIVAHRLSTIRNADLIVVMKDGHCVEQGSYEELMALEGEYYQLQKLNERNAEMTTQD